MILRQVILQKSLGKKTGAQMYNFCRGIDDRKLEIQQVSFYSVILLIA